MWQPWQLSKPWRKEASLRERLTIWVIAGSICSAANLMTKVSGWTGSKESCKICYSLSPSGSPVGQSHCEGSFGWAGSPGRLRTCSWQWPAPEESLSEYHWKIIEFEDHMFSNLTTLLYSSTGLLNCVLHDLVSVSPRKLSHSSSSL